MTPTSGHFRRNDEVDRVRWTTMEEAASVMSYDHDRAVVVALAEHLARTA